MADPSAAVQNPGPASAPRSAASDTRRALLLAVGLCVALLLAVVSYLVLPYPALIAAVFLLGALLLGALYRSFSLARPPEPAGPLSQPAAATASPGDVGPELEAMIAAARTDEVDTLMREFTRILGVLQQQASQVQDYAGRFEAMNEELRNANLRLRELSLTDELTEVGNRRNFDVRMREEINRSTRFGHAFSLLLLDIDLFKKFNDEYGHPQGNVVLRGLGSLMRSMSREGDVPCRIGGEEFAFILPETVKPDATLFAERMRRGVEATIKTPEGEHSVTVSIGLAAFPEDGKSPEDLERAADEALYESKHAGRNRVTAYHRK
ncbi:MAG TPA: GGDEF domain-containing protein [Methylomirabilota bacterium]|jgi:diguanylate cyclase (GGDEF)-like protein|nr:GGDEF domain-containing protein [Methylomirabilota bacterium]